MYAKVIVPLSVRNSFTYSVPSVMSNDVSIGDLVNVQVGQRTYCGVVQELTETEDGAFTIKSIVSRTDIKLLPKQLDFLLWMADYYMAYPGEVLKAAIPIGIRQNRLKPQIEKWLSHNPDNIVQLDVLNSMSGVKAQKAVLTKWLSAGCPDMIKADFIKLTGASSSVLRSLIEKSWLIEEERLVKPKLLSTEVETSSAKSLSLSQKDAFEKIQNLFETKPTVLLHGVTSSGKTELYISLIKKCIDEGKQALYLLPEIGLTVQIVRRLKEVFGDNVAVYHSAITEKERITLWQRQTGDNPIKVVVGARSSIFLPFKTLGLVVVDEENDTSYKQTEPTPRYNGRDSAIMLASYYGAKTVLGSATPSFETYSKAHSGKYGYVKLDERFGGAEMPEIRIANIFQARRKKIIKGNFTPMLFDAIKTTTDNGGQVILIHNRKGYSSYLQCEECGYVPTCSGCGVSMTYFKLKNVIMCKYCGRTMSMTNLCPQCHKGHYILRNSGVERIEDDIRKYFPNLIVDRLDADITTAGIQKTIDKFARGDTNILVGTQLVTKGLDFDNVKLVGFIDTDSMLRFPDFRSEENVFTMLMQAAGRCGRKGDRGVMIVQTSDENNSMFEMLKRSDIISYYSSIENERRLFSYPPFSRLIKIEVRAKSQEMSLNVAQRIADSINSVKGVTICGPSIPEIAKIRDVYRCELLIKMILTYAKASSFKRFMLKNIYDVCAKNLKIKILTDVDPL